jgi:histidinol-phosphate/aromatic aminotransferase/cobyric acid decarboxylase-like protein
MAFPTRCQAPTRLHKPLPDRANASQQSRRFEPKNLRRVQSEHAAVARGFRPAPAALGGEPRADADLRADADALRAVHGVEVFASDANFLLFRIARAAAVFEALAARRVLVKNVSRAHPLLADCLRVTVGTPAENRRFIAALHEAVADLG